MQEKQGEKIKEFTCYPLMCVFNRENFKIYAVDAELKDMPELKPNKYGNYTLIGNFHELEFGAPYKVKAKEEKSKNGYGYQYQVIHIKREKPLDESATRRFLSAILNSQEQVDELMNNYPDIIDRVINNQLEDIDLNKLYNIGEFRFNVIKRKIEENFIFAELIEMFQGLIDMSIVKKLYEKYASVEKIKEEVQKDPYYCLCSLSRVGFKTADNTILKLDYESKELKKKGEMPPIYFNFDIRTSIQRATAAVEYLLQKNEEEGHTKISIKNLKNEFDKLIPDCKDMFNDAIDYSNNIHIQGEEISLLETYKTELYVANKIKEALAVENKWEDIDVDKFKALDDGNELTDEQLNAIKMFSENNISILNGNAGCGKSFTVQTIINLIQKLNKSFHLLCPTGRAAKVLSGYTGETAYTIHRGLGYNPSANPQWAFNENRKLPYDVVIVDESSMIDIFLMYNLIRTIDFTKTKLLFIGDDFQIPSVGAGNVLYDMINSNIIPITTLTRIFRFGIGGIHTISTQTRLGEKWIKSSKKYNVFGDDKGYIYKHVEQESIIKELKKIYKKILKNNSTPEDILVLSSYNKGEYGTVKINNEIQKIVNPNCNNNLNFGVGNTIFYLDDIVIQTVNNYRAKIYNSNIDTYSNFMYNNTETFISNGDIGKVIIIEKDFMVVRFDDHNIIFNREEAMSLKLAYCISIHKSQGGNCKNIILLTPKSHTYMLNANLIYVGQTRATERCYHLGEVKTINIAIKKRMNLERKTHLKELLLQNLDENNSNKNKIYKS